MAYYIIDKITNKINPNAITGEVALYETEEDFINAKQQWIIDNTIGKVAPDKSNYKYMVATNEEIEQYRNDYLAFKLSQTTKTSIVVSAKYNPDISNTHRINIQDYFLGQIQEEVIDLEYMYVATEGDLLTQFLANEQAELIETEAKKISIARENAIQYISDKISSYQIIYLICNTDSNGNIIPTQHKKLDGVDFDYTFKRINVLDASNVDPVPVIDVNRTMEIYVTTPAIIETQKSIAKNFIKQDLLKEQTIAHLRNNCHTIAEIDATVENFNNLNNQDTDEIKDGANTVFISKNDITIYDLTQSFLVITEQINKEDTNITDIILNFK